MKTQRFVGSSVKEAYAAARTALGKEAMILKQTQSNGQVELLATLEEETIVVTESGSLKPILINRLLESGFSQELIDTIPSNQTTWEAVLRFLISKVSIEKPPVILDGRWRFSGPPGSGKTSTLIKILTQAIIEGLDPDECLVVSTDHAKLGGCEPLALAAELLGFKWVSVPSEKIPKLLMEQAQRRLIMIDSGGGEVNRLTSLSSVHDVGILPATWQYGSLERLAAVYRRLGVFSYAMTFVDLAEQLGGLLSLLMGSNTPLNWISDGIRLPDDIRPASHDYFLDRLLFRIDRNQIRTMFA